MHLIIEPFIHKKPAIRQKHEQWSYGKGLVRVPDLLSRGIDAILDEQDKINPTEKVIYNQEEQKQRVEDIYKLYIEDNMRSVDIELIRLVAILAKVTLQIVDVSLSDK